VEDALIHSDDLMMILLRLNTDILYVNITPVDINDWYVCVCVCVCS